MREMLLALALLTAAPMQTSGPVPKLPRLTAFPDANIRAKVNLALARREKSDRAARTDCKAQSPDAFDYRERADVTWLSARAMSVVTVAEWFCGGAHPDAETRALTIDLTTGAQIDWAAVFKPDYDAALRKLYRARYANTDAQCRDMVKSGFSDDLVLWLDARKHALMVAPDFAHAVAACADPVALDAGALAPLVADPKFLDALR
ncbi:MAG TPA: hypothetical protein VG889_21340 [Rhizomicrobium sp.]|nr:hypothetical protein [Rhizomicrobium sp.]